MHLMIDFETLDTGPDAVVLSVGVVAFNKDGIHDKFTMNLDAQEQINTGRIVNFETIKWWMKQGNEAIQSAFFDKKYSIKEYKICLTEFCKKNEIQECWSQGANFDLPINESLLGKDNPLKFWNARDTRTFYKYNVGSLPKRESTHHNALEDAIYQAECVIIGLNK